MKDYYNSTYKAWVVQTFTSACNRFLNEISHYSEDVSDIKEQLLLLISKIQRKWNTSSK